MKLDLKNLINKRGLFKTISLALFFSLFFPIRHVFFNSQAYKIGQYSDFTAFSLYLSDIILIMLAISIIIPRGKKFFSSFKPIISLILWILLILLLNIRFNNRSNLYYYGKALEFFVAYGTFTTLLQERPLKDWVLRTFVFFCTIQAILALWQFIIQSYVGLNKLGEQPLSPKTLGFAKIIVDGITYIRGYGTFPHPNPLSAFLTMGVLILVYYISLSATKTEKVVYSVLLFINLLGLTVAFSRAAMIATVLGATIYCGILLTNKRLTIHVRSTAIIFAACLVTIAIIFQPFLLTRATVTDSASLARIFYAKVSLQIIQHNPIFGVGLGESVLHMQQYSPIHLQPWDILPVHNYFLLAATEMGIIGAFILTWIFLSHVINLMRRPLTTYNLLLITIFIAFLILMQFDHYFYTLQQTQLLLWIVLGLIAAEMKIPHNKAGEVVALPPA